MEAAKEGLFLSPGISFEWVGTKGPYGLSGKTANVYEDVMTIAIALGADLDAMRLAQRVVRPRADLMHEESGVIIEVDELQHFTSHRLLSFESYPSGAPLGFDLEDYRDLCEQHRVKADKAWGTKKTATFGPKSRGRQRAFYDALKDLSLPAAGLPPVVRIAVPDRDYIRAWKQVRDRVFAAVADGA
ncbi:hypothetical protein PV772_15785 [Pseudarthrobacter sp. CC12]|uniref:DUF7255 family protein n=1 Tax=Pseudarthrobacter sp. CC12 TaxID=3029193 RepID=UPI003264EF9A